MRIALPPSVDRIGSLTANSTVSGRLFNSDCKNGIPIAMSASRCARSEQRRWRRVIIRVGRPVANRMGGQNQQNALDSGESFLLITYLRKACV